VHTAALLPSLFAESLLGRSLFLRFRKYTLPAHGRHRTRIPARVAYMHRNAGLLLPTTRRHTSTAACCLVACRTRRVLPAGCRRVCRLRVPSAPHRATFRYAPERTAEPCARCALTFCLPLQHAAHRDLRIPRLLAVCCRISCFTSTRAFALSILFFT